MGLDARKPFLGGLRHNKGADQPAQMISAFVIPIWKNIIPKLATVEIAIFWLVCVSEESGLSLTLSETLEVLSRQGQHRLD